MSAPHAHHARPCRITLWVTAGLLLLFMIGVPMLTESSPFLVETLRGS